MNSLEEYLEEAISNIKSDRAATNSLLMDVMIYLKKNEENHKNVGFVVAKYLETLQRSNDQLIKITSILSKEQNKDASLSASDREELFDLIKDPQ